VIVLAAAGNGRAPRQALVPHALAGSMLSLERLGAMTAELTFTPEGVRVRIHIEDRKESR
jgi:hypothetical protein